METIDVFYSLALRDPPFDRQRPSEISYFSKRPLPSNTIFSYGNYYFHSFFHWCTPIYTYFATVDQLLQIFQFYNTTSSIYSFFLLSCRYFKKGGRRFFCSPYMFSVLRPISLFLALKRFTVAIMNQMAIISVKNPSSDSNSPGGDVVNQLPLFLTSEAQIFPKICE